MNKLRWSDVTPERLVLNRRALLAGVGALAATPALAARAVGEPNTYEEITTYNNYYEFGTGKTDPARYGDMLTMDPWSVQIDGLVDRPGSYSLADIAPENAREDRIYRLRCVEAWSMVIPWTGVPLAGVLARAAPQPSAKFVNFQTLLRPSEMPGQKTRMLDWPYEEGLRLDEAMHPLTLLVTGLYGKDLPAQNGGPIRLMVPWKYGFKSAKSVVRMTLTDKRPVSTWERAAPSEYGFYANVNPQVDHPRWSQATERRIGAGLFGGREETLMFNGYADEVAALYAGQDLARDY